MFLKKIDCHCLVKYDVTNVKNIGEDEMMFIYYKIKILFNKNYILYGKR